MDFQPISMKKRGLSMMHEPLNFMIFNITKDNLHIHK